MPLHEYACKECGRKDTRLVLKKDARYWGKGNPPYCPLCYAILASGDELPPKPDQTEFDFDV